MLPLTRTFKIYKTAIQFLVDFLFLNLSTGLMYLFRFKIFPAKFDETIQRLSGWEYLYFGIIFSLGVIVVYALLGVYEIHRKKSIPNQILDLTLGVFWVVFTIISFFFFYEFNTELFPNGVPVSRFILLTLGFVGVFFVLCGRTLVWMTFKVLQSYGIGRIKIALVGQHVKETYKFFKKQSHIEQIYHYPVLSLKTLDQLKLKIINKEISEIYTFGEQSGNFEGQLAWYAERYKVNFAFAPEGFGRFQFFDLYPRRINGKLFLEILHSNIDGWRVIFKRLFDIVFASCFLLIFSPIFVIIALAIYLEDQAPVLYFSDRVGPDGKTFKLWKFRRLKYSYCTGLGKASDEKSLEYEQELIKQNDMRQDGILYKIHDDPRNTKVGRFIEKTSLDELPQFVNVLLGNMSVVGPRPHQPREVAKYNNEHYKVLNIKPGITGLSQINGRSDLKFDQEVELDCYYIEHWSFSLDIWIIIKTPFVLLFGKHKN
jgi:exopolysaccharide biosynthesis polyprenyl glycosylphosphotransferase